jgi:hypothetical protein
MPGAARTRAASDGGALKGGAPRTVWQALGSDPRVVTARSASQRLLDFGRPSHLVWNPLDGEIVQLIPITRAARSLGWPEGPDELPRFRAGWPQQACPPELPADGPPSEINREGRLCVQICVVAFAWEPFTSGPMTGLQEILDWLDSWHMPRTWPAGRPAPYPHGHATFRNRRQWSRGGHFGASQVPEWTATGPGAVDVSRLTGRPRPAAAPEPRQPGEAVVGSIPDLADIFGTAGAASSLTRVG